MSIEAQIRDRLMVAFTPQRLDVINQSHLHAGHGSSPGTGESHYEVLIVSGRFQGLSRVERHRLVNTAVGELLASKVHALALRTYAPGEKIV